MTTPRRLRRPEAKRVNGGDTGAWWHRRYSTMIRPRLHGYSVPRSKVILPVNEERAAQWSEAGDVVFGFSADNFRRMWLGEHR